MTDENVDNSERDHAVLHVKMLEKSEYAVDLSSAQYGHAEPVVAWDTYTTTRLRDGPYAPEPYSNWASWGRKDQGQWEESATGLQASLHHLKAMFDGHIKMWLVREKMNVRELAALEEDQFKERLDRLLQDIAERFWRSDGSVLEALGHQA